MTFLRIVRLLRVMRMIRLLRFLRAPWQFQKMSEKPSILLKETARNKMDAMDVVTKWWRKESPESGNPFNMN